MSSIHAQFKKKINNLDFLNYFFLNFINFYDDNQNTENIMQGWKHNN